jgi:hypothetical protein
MLQSGSDARGRGPSEASPTPSGMYCHSLHLLQATIYLFQPAVAATADPSSDSEAEQRPTQRRRGNNDQSKSKKRKKRPGRQQPSRSIREIPLEHQPIVKATYPVIQREIVCTSGWAKDSPSGKPGASDDELGNMILDSWDEAHEALDLPYVGPPTTPEKNLVSFFLFHTTQLIWDSFLDSLARTCRPNGVQEGCVTTRAWPIWARRSTEPSQFNARVDCCNCRGESGYHRKDRAHFLLLGETGGFTFAFC